MRNQSLTQTLVQRLRLRKRKDGILGLFIVYFPHARPLVLDIEKNGGNKTLDTLQYYELRGLQITFNEYKKLIKYYNYYSRQQRYQ